MKNNAYTNALTPPTQTERANERQVKNNAGGFVYAVSDKTRLERFLILGTTGGTYYQSEKDYTKQNLDFLVGLIKSDGVQVVSVATTISQEGRAYKNSPAIFALALVFKHGSDEAKAMAKAAVPKICRTATAVFELATYFEALGGWSRARRSAIADWYNGKTADQVAYQAVKYRQRDGWTHRDLFRLVHPKGLDRNVGNFILGKDEKSAAATSVDVPAIIRGFKFAQESRTSAELLNVALTDFPNLPWEALPTQFLKDPEVWKKLFYNGQLNGQALVRNITRLARIKAFDDMGFARDYANRLMDEDSIKKSRLHPINFMNAIVVHNEGQVDRKGYGRKKDWDTVSVINDALNDAFYKSFKYVEPAGKRTFIAIDVSPSMDSPAMGLDLTCSQVAAAMAMSVAKTEPYYMIRGFASAGYNYGGRGSGLTDLGVSPSMRLDAVVRKMQNSSWGGTDCSLPMKYAMENNIKVDTFLILTDNDTWAGTVHADEMLRRYRKHSGIPARMIVAGMTATNFTIADPNDSGMMDVCGADANLPRLVADFSAGRI